MIALLAVGIAIVAIASALASPPAPGSPASARPGADGGRARAAGLKRFRSCPQLGRYARAHRRALTPFPGNVVPDAIGGGAAGPGAGAAAESGAPSLARASRSDSGTNIQEQGVDEPDIVKTNGSTIFAIVDGRLEATDGGAGGPRHLGSLQLPSGPGTNPYSYGHQLLLVGDRALVLSTANLDRAPVCANGDLRDRDRRPGRDASRAHAQLRRLLRQRPPDRRDRPGGRARPRPIYPFAVGAPGPVGGRARSSRRRRRLARDRAAWAGGCRRRGCTTTPPASTGAAVWSAAARFASRSSSRASRC